MRISCLLLLCPGVLNEDLYAVLRLELTDKPGIPMKSCHDPLEYKPSTQQTHHSSLAIPRSLQQRIRALLLHASVAVGMPFGSKYSCSPRAIPTSLHMQRGQVTCEQHRAWRTHLPRQTNAYSLLTLRAPTDVSLRGANPHPPGPNALFSTRRYLISGR